MEGLFKHVLITGGTGSLGREITKYLLMMQMREGDQITIYSRGEVKQAQMRQEMSELANARGVYIRYVIGDVRSYDRLFQVMKGVTCVIHAAALKRVDTIEENPSEAIDTNVNGARNVIRACTEHKVKAVVALSTDKACNPINLYGATKLCSDKLFISANQDSLPHTRFMVVRYGNVFTR